jgi:hypothetical protein
MQHPLRAVLPAWEPDRNRHSYVFIVEDARAAVTAQARKCRAGLEAAPKARSMGADKHRVVWRLASNRLLGAEAAHAEARGGCRLSLRPRRLLLEDLLEVRHETGVALPDQGSHQREHQSHQP